MDGIKRWGQGEQPRIYREDSYQEKQEASETLEELWTEIYEMVDEIQEAVLPNHST